MERTAEPALKCTPLLARSQTPAAHHLVNVRYEGCLPSSRTAGARRSRDSRDNGAGAHGGESVTSRV